MSRTEEPFHKPVLVDEVLKYLDPVPDDVILDCTFGSGGHAGVLTKRLGPDGTYVALDWDPESPEYASFDPEDRSCEFVFKEGNFARARELLHDWREVTVDACLADLGWSMDQLRRGGKGLSFERDEFLDMRYNPDARETAADLLHQASEDELATLFEKHGERRYGALIAERIVEQRDRRPFRRTFDLLDLIASITGERRKKETAARIFQALRVCVNDELENLEKLLDQLQELLKPGGRACVISFHSLEDRLVKEAFAKGAERGIYEVLTEKPVRPAEDQVEENPSARSAKLRVVERKTS